MMNEQSDPTCRFYRMIPGIPEPRRADRSADGMLSVRALRSCEAVTSASGNGWYFYPPLDFALEWTAKGLRWTYAGAAGWYPLGGAQFPGFRSVFSETAPPALKELSPPFLAAAREPGVVQIWTGYGIRTAKNWAIVAKGPTNIPRQGYDYFEGIIEADEIHELITIVVRLDPNNPVHFVRQYPMMQVVPILRDCYQKQPYGLRELSDLDADDWDGFGATLERNAGSQRRLGHYAVAVRKRARGCPIAAGELDREPADVEAGVPRLAAE